MEASVKPTWMYSRRPGGGHVAYPAFPLVTGTELVLNAPSFRLLSQVSVATGATLHVPKYGCGGISTFETGKTHVQKIHVAPDGDDIPGCESAMSPCANIEHAAILASPGTAIVVHEGTCRGDPESKGPRCRRLNVGGGPSRLLRRHETDAIIALVTWTPSGEH